LYIAEQKHQLLEIEFYFTNDLHPDPYTHCNPEQITSGNWYFHVNKRKNGQIVYREKQFAGVDVSIGDGDGGSGGILIRSMKDCKTNTVYCGPGQVMERIVLLSGEQTVAGMVQTHFSGSAPDELSVQRMNSFMYMFISDEKRKATRCYQSPRVGLFLTKANVPLESQIHYMIKNYRFLRDIKDLWKGKHYVAYNLYLNRTSVNDIAALIGESKERVHSWINSYNMGNDLDITAFTERRLNVEEDMMKCFGVCNSGK
jgi:hypothetical protein